MHMYGVRVSVSLLHLSMSIWFWFILGLSECNNLSYLFVKFTPS